MTTSAEKVETLVLDYGRKCMTFGLQGPDEYPQSTVDDARNAVLGRIADIVHEKGKAEWERDAAWRELEREHVQGLRVAGELHLTKQGAVRCPDCGYKPGERGEVVS